MEKLNSIKKKKAKEKNKFIHINRFNIEFNEKFPIIKLVKKDNGDIIAYQNNTAVGIVSNEFNWDKKLYLTDDELEKLPKTSYGKCFLYSNPLEHESGNGTITIELLDDNKVKQETIIRKYPKEMLITITATGFYNHPQLKEGMKLKLVKEPENTHDRDAIAVYLNENKIGYVSNSDKTNCRFTSKASQLKDLPDISYAEYLIYYNNYYHVAVIKTDIE